MPPTTEELIFEVSAISDDEIKNYSPTGQFVIHAAKKIQAENRATKKLLDGGNKQPPVQ